MGLAQLLLLFPSLPTVTATVTCKRRNKQQLILIFFLVHGSVFFFFYLRFGSAFLYTDLSFLLVLPSSLFQVGDGKAKRLPATELLSRLASGDGEEIGRLGSYGVGLAAITRVRWSRCEDGRG